MNIYEIMKNRRTIRKFTRKSIDHDLLLKFIDHARLSPSGMNSQTIRYMIIDDESIANKVFPHTRWAGYLKGAHSPTFDERPAAYILLLTPQEYAYSKHDVGAVAQSIQLMAWYEGIGSCWMGAIDREEIAKICNVPKEYKIDTLLSLGYPAEEPISIEIQGDDVKYFEDETGRLNVPKYSLDDIILRR